MQLPRKTLIVAAVASLFLAGSHNVDAAARAGIAAPAFTAKDIAGKLHKLADYKGKYVVLEWFNHGCPFVQKHYGSNTMQALQKKWTAKGVVWLSINSGAKGKEGFEDDVVTAKTAKDKGTQSTAIFVDGAGTLGKLYGASSTPHMFVIDPSGKVVYAGAIDSIASTDKADLAKAVNYVDAALVAATTGKLIKVAESAPYGCGVHY